MKVVMAAITDVGMVREKNEDQVAIAPELGLAILADGMGGHKAGEVASDMAIDLITRHLTESFEAIDENKRGLQNEGKIIDQAIQLANTAIFEMAQKRPECNGMGATIVVALFYNGRLYVGHVGDSRLYRLRSGELQQVTEDHSVVQELLTRGLISDEEARSSAHKNLVTRALGIDTEVEPDIDSQALEDNDVYLLCSDGLSDVLPDETMEQMLAANSSDLVGATQFMLNTANEQGGPDNISIILVKVGEQLKGEDIFPIRELEQ